MHEHRRHLSAEQPRETNLAARGRKEVLASHHEINALPHVVHGDGELVGPVAVSIAQQEIAALGSGVLRLLAEETVLEPFRAPGDLDANAAGGVDRQAALVRKIAMLMAGTGRE